MCQVLDWINEAGVRPDMITFNTLMQICIQFGATDKALEVLRISWPDSGMQLTNVWGLCQVLATMESSSASEEKAFNPNATSYGLVCHYVSFSVTVAHRFPSSSWWLHLPMQRTQRPPKRCFSA